MSIKIIQDRLDSYRCQSETEEEQAIKEITQEIVLLGLSRSGFFKSAAFQGGTCLRILYGLNRFSEDLDFALFKAESNFQWNNFVRNLTLELNFYGYNITVTDRSKLERSVKKVFVKENSIGNILSVQYARRTHRPITIQIRLEIDTNPPEGANYINKHLDFPLPFVIVSHDMPSLFAGKLHSLICRPYIKGRDWFDFIWYMGKKIVPNYKLLSNALEQSGGWKGKKLDIDRKWVLEELKKRIESIDWNGVREDVERFLRPHDQAALNMWGKPFFIEMLNRLES